MRRFPLNIPVIVTAVGASDALRRYSGGVVNNYTNNYTNNINAQQLILHNGNASSTASPVNVTVNGSLLVNSQASASPTRYDVPQPSTDKHDYVPRPADKPDDVPQPSTDNHGYVPRPADKPGDVLPLFTDKPPVNVSLPPAEAPDEPSLALTCECDAGLVPGRFVNGHNSCGRCATAWYRVRRNGHFEGLKPDEDYRMQIWLSAEKLVSGSLLIITFCCLFRTSPTSRKPTQNTKDAAESSNDATLLFLR